MLCFEGHDGERIGGSPHFSLLHDFCHGLLAGIVRRIGPGLILAAGIVGSGELIATTILGAENDYSLLWLILVTCSIKVVAQNELGRYCIGTGETTLENPLQDQEFRVVRL